MVLSRYRGIILLGIIGLVLMIYFLFDPMHNVWMPKCLFHRFTGLQCMGCGSQRVIHHLLHGELSEAFHANALLVVSLPFLLFLAWLEISHQKFNNLYRKVHSQAVIIIIAVILGVWFIIRNILGI